MKLMKRFKKNEKGFTLIELIVVIAIIAILAALIVPRFVNFSADAEEAVAKQDAKALAKMIAMYQAGESGLPDGTKLKYTGGATGESQELIFSHDSYGYLTISNVASVHGSTDEKDSTSTSVFDSTDKNVEYRVSIKSKSYDVDIKKNGKVTVSLVTP